MPACANAACGAAGAAWVHPATGAAAYSAACALACGPDITLWRESVDADVEGMRNEADSAAKIIKKIERVFILINSTLNRLESKVDSAVEGRKTFVAFARANTFKADAAKAREAIDEWDAVAHEALEDVACRDVRVAMGNKVSEWIQRAREQIDEKEARVLRSR